MTAGQPPSDRAPFVPPVRTTSTVAVDRGAGVPLLGTIDEVAYRELERAVHGADRGAVLVLLLSGLDDIAVRKGYAAARDVYRIVARRLHASLPGGCHLERLGDTRLAIVVQPPDDQPFRKRLEWLASRIVEVLSEPIPLAGLPTTLNPRVGVLPLPYKDLSLDSLLWRADLAAHHAEEGVGYAFYDAAVGSELNLRRRLEEVLHQALADRAIRVEFVPRLRSSDKSVVGADAEVRWRAGGTDVAPATMLPLIQESGQIVQVSDWTIRTACEALAAWPRPQRRRLSVSIPVTASELTLPGRVDSILAVIESAGCAFDTVELRFAESDVLGLGARVIPALEALRSEGVRLCLDHFGEGADVLVRLPDIPLDSVRVHGALVDGAEGSVYFSTVIRSLVDAAEALDLTLSASGVGTVGQISVLRDAGVDSLAGPFISGPLDRDEFGQMLVDGKLGGRARVGSPLAVFESSKLSRPPRSLPVLPAVLASIARLDMRRKDFPEALARMAACDPMFAAKLLRLAASSASGNVRVITSVSQALNRIGGEHLARAFTRVNVSEVFLPNEGQQKGMWLHSVQTGLWAAALCHADTDVQAFTSTQGYTAGLMHDVGRFAMLDQTPIRCGRVEAEPLVSPSGLIDVEVGVYGFDHAMVGAALCRAWRLPQELTFMVAHHHQRREDRQDLWTPRERRLIQIVQVADELSVTMITHPKLAGGSREKRIDEARRCLGMFTSGRPPLGAHAIADRWWRVAELSIKRCHRVGILPDEPLPNRTADAIDDEAFHESL